MIKFREHTVKHVIILQGTSEESLCNQIEAVGSNFELIDLQFSVTVRGTVRRKKDYHALVLLGEPILSQKPKKTPSKGISTTRG